LPNKSLPAFLGLDFQRQIDLDGRLNGDADRSVKVDVNAAALQSDNERIAGHPIDDLWSRAVTPPTTYRLDAQPVSPQEINRRSAPDIAMQ
jgi:hypothetical protein